MCRPVLRILLLITSLPAGFGSEEKTVEKRLVDNNLKYGNAEGNQNLLDTLDRGNLYQNGEGNHLPLGEHRFPQASVIASVDTPIYGTNEETVDDFDLNGGHQIHHGGILVQQPYSIINPDVVSGKTLPLAGSPLPNNNIPPPGLSPSLIRAEIPQSSPRVIGTIGSGSVGYTNLGGGLYAIGSGGLGFAAHVPSQTGKGSITYRNRPNQNIYRDEIYQNILNSFDENTPHAYPRPIDLKRELSEKN